MNALLLIISGGIFFLISNVLLFFVRIPFSEEALAIMAHFHLFLCGTCCTSAVPCPLGYCWSTLGYIRFCLDECYWLYHVRVRLFILLPWLLSWYSLISQIKVLEKPHCSVFLGFTTSSIASCFSWHIQF